MNLNINKNVLVHMLIIINFKYKTKLYIKIDGNFS